MKILDSKLYRMGNESNLVHLTHTLSGLDITVSVF